MQKIVKWTVLLSIMVLPFLIYFLFVYSANENFFLTLDYVGPKQTIETEEGFDTTYYQIPEWEFTDQDGQLLTRKDMEGKIYLSSFFFCSCPSICPVMNFHLKTVFDRFEGREHFYIISHSVDPERDSVPVLKAYAKERGYDHPQWRFVTGTKGQVYDVANSYFLNAMEDHLAPGGFLHSESVVLVDWNGHIRSRKDDNGNIVALYNVLEPVELNMLKEDIKVLIAEQFKEEAREAKKREDAKKALDEK